MIFYSTIFTMFLLQKKSLRRLTERFLPIYCEFVIIDKSAISDNRRGICRSHRRTEWTFRFFCRAPYC